MLKCDRASGTVFQSTVISYRCSFAFLAATPAAFQLKQTSDLRWLHAIYNPQNTEV